MNASRLGDELLETVINRALMWLDRDVFDALIEMDDRVVAVDVTGTGRRFVLRCGARGVELLESSAGPVDVCIAGTPGALARLVRAGEDADPLFEGEVAITGDVATAQRLKTILARTHIDWEELLSKAVGDVAAHQLGNAVRSARDWSSRARGTLLRDLGEYLSEEARLVPGRAELGAFMAAVDVLRDDVERIEKRVERLQRRRAERGG
jgi:ubiquinone biosynthesis accessory factor UbiJ